MNRLIIIGNGFDLAHGLKTDYNSFIKWYLKKAYNKAYNVGKFVDDLMIIKLRQSDLSIFDSPDSFVDFYYKKGFKEVVDNADHRTASQVTTQPFETEIIGVFFRELILSCSDKNWVDIESLFYRHLKLILNSRNPLKREATRNLNKTLAYIIEQLQEYLSQIKIESYVPEYKELMLSQVNSVVFGSNYSTRQPDNTMVLTFNYTKTVEQYVNYVNDVSGNNNYAVSNYIHGKLGVRNNPIIFGFGDELDENYKKIELANQNELFEYIKSFWYFKTTNYHDLARFIKSNYFEVFVWGHSCGLSDRTLLNMIFENSNCLAIKLFYYDWGTGDNFTDLTYEISRHFNDKSSMRLKIQPKQVEFIMPQYWRHKPSIQE